MNCRRPLIAWLIAGWLAAALAAPAIAVGQQRTWTDNRGRTIEAKFLRAEAGQVYLSIGGREIKYPLSGLSKEDQAYVAEQTAKGVSHSHEGADEKDASDSEGSSPFAQPSASADAAGQPGAARLPGRERHERGELRTWTDSEGRHQRARFVRVHDEMVILNSGSKTISIAFAQLSADDQQYVREVLEDRGEGHLAPALTQYDFGDLEADKPADRGQNAAIAGVGGAAVAGPGPRMGGGIGRGPSGGGPPPGFPGGRFGGAGPGRFGPHAGAEVDPAMIASADPYGGGGRGSSISTVTRSTSSNNAVAANNPYAPSGAAAANGSGAFPSTSEMDSGLDSFGSSRPERGIAANALRDRSRAYGSAALDSAASSPSQTASTPIYTERIVYACSNCNKEVSSGQAGDKCPHCGTVWMYEEGPDGKRKFAASVLTSPAFWATSGGVLFVSILGVVMRVLIVAARKW